jgi:hypothetical protein
VRAILRYTAERLLLLAGAAGLCYALGLRDIALWVVAVLGSGAASFVLLNRQRDAMAVVVERSLNRVNERIDAATRKEDVD